MPIPALPILIGATAAAAAAGTGLIYRKRRERQKRKLLREFAEKRSIDLQVLERSKKELSAIDDALMVIKSQYAAATSKTSSTTNDS